MTAIRIGFIGAGGYARVHIDGFLQLQSEGVVKIVALSDVSAEVLRDLCCVPGLRDRRTKSSALECLYPRLLSCL
jgi:predicted dehydrogenase